MCQWPWSFVAYCGTPQADKVCACTGKWLYAYAIVPMRIPRWRFVAHGGVDGYSRMIVNFRCGNNNKAETVLSCLHTAVSRYGLPSRVGADRGG